MTQPIDLFTNSGRFDKTIVTNLLKGTHDPDDLLPYSMLLDAYKGRRYARTLLEHVLLNENITLVPQAHQFVLFHDQVIEALCRHYDASRFLQD